jgi:hypothetical protein
MENTVLCCSKMHKNRQNTYTYAYSQNIEEEGSIPAFTDNIYHAMQKCNTDSNTKYNISPSTHI